MKSRLDADIAKPDPDSEITGVVKLIAHPAGFPATMQIEMIMRGGASPEKASRTQRRWKNRRWSLGRAMRLKLHTWYRTSPSRFRITARAHRHQRNRVLLQPVQSAVFARRAANGLPECLVEAAEPTEARTQRDLQDQVLGGHEQSLRVRRPVLSEVLCQRGAKGSLEQGHRIIGVQTHVLADRLGSQRLCVVLGDKKGHLFRPAQMLTTSHFLQIASYADSV